MASAVVIILPIVLLPPAHSVLWALLCEELVANSEGAPLPGDRDAGSASVDGHVCAAGGGEGFAVPAGPPVLQAQPGDPRHQIELARPGVPRDDRVQAHALAREDHVALLVPLRHGIVAPHVEAHLVDDDSFGI